MENERFRVEREEGRKGKSKRKVEGIDKQTKHADKTDV